MPPTLAMLYDWATGIRQIQTTIWGHNALITLSFNSPFAVGKVNTSTAGQLVTDRFGNVYVEGSPFRVGHIEGVYKAGELYMDNFGDVYVKGSHFSVDATEALNLKD